MDVIFFVRQLFHIHNAVRPVYISRVAWLLNEYTIFPQAMKLYSIIYGVFCSLASGQSHIDLQIISYEYDFNGKQGV